MFRFIKELLCFYRRKQAEDFKDDGFAYDIYLGSFYEKIRNSFTKTH